MARELAVVLVPVEGLEALVLRAAQVVQSVALVRPEFGAARVLVGSSPGPGRPLEPRDRGRTQAQLAALALE